jgi:WD40 repeat protein
MNYGRLMLAAILQAIILIAFIFSPETKAAEPPREPILKIETGMHTAAIKRIGVDAENRYLVTGSNDKTIRVWELAAGRLVKIIRPPIGDGNEGLIFGVAMSPDGRNIACGGWTAQNWDDMYASVYIFDRESGRLIKRISGLSSTVFQITYSKDGRYLFIGLWGNNGIRVYDTYNYSLVKEDRDYGSDVYGADFDRQGRLVTASYDGYIRLYDQSFRLVSKRKAQGGNQAYGVSFSPDGSRIAVGFNDTRKVDVVSGYDLSYFYSPDSSGVDNGNMVAVSWSADGRTLYAGGMYWSRSLNKRAIRKWTDEGRGRYVDLPASSDTILHILPLRNGDMVYSSSEPAFGIFDAYDRRALFKGPYIADYRDNREGFVVSYDGSIVKFGYEQWGKSPAGFSVLDRMLDADGRAISNSGLYPPITSAEGLDITGWQYTHSPKLNGAPLKLDKYERAISLAIAPDRQSFLLGCDWYLRLFDRYGNVKWKVPAPGVAWSVNISGNGKAAVGAFADGTIRWYSMRDGKQIMALFPHNDKRRWVLWTPSGYYDSSAGADDVIGWHLNNGKESEAYFFPISKFRTTYYRPDVVAKVLSTTDEGEAIRLANNESGRKKQEASVQQMLPPVVNIISPASGSVVSLNEIIVRFSVKSPSGEPVTAIKALVDGRPAATERGVKIVGQEQRVSDDVKEIRIVIPEKDSEIAVIAENKYSVSEPAIVRLKWAGGVKKEEFIIKPKLYILAVGISRYSDKNLTLGFAAKDAVDFASAALKQKTGLYRDVVVKTITDEKATKDDILDGLEWLQKETTSKDVAMVFLAGHGVNDPSGIYYFLPVNASTEKLKRTGVPFSDIKNTVASLAGKTIMFIDTCHSGNIMGTRRGAADITGIVNELASAENGAIVFASSTGNQYSLEDSKWGNGAFTKALIEGLNGKADYTGKGKITINMLDLYLSERVKELTGGKQTPTTTKPNTISDFPVAVKK